MKFIPFALLHVGSQTLLVAGEGDVDHDQEEEHEAEGDHHCEGEEEDDAGRVATGLQHTG